MFYSNHTVGNRKRFSLYIHWICNLECVWSWELGFIRCAAIYKCVPLAGRSSDLKYVTGYVLGRSFSGVQGYVRNHRFYGTIFVRNSVLFVEPIVSNNQIRFPYYVTSSRRMVKKKGSLNAYVYKIYSRNLRPRRKQRKPLQLQQMERVPTGFHALVLFT